MTLLALLHGGMHRSWSWDLVISALSRHGLDTVAPELPVDDDAAGAHEWACVAANAINRVADPADPDVIVVGHSIAGLCVPIIANLRPVRRMIFLAGLIPAPGQTFVEHLAANPDAMTFDAELAPDGGPFGLTWESVRNGFYHDCPEPLARRAFNGLRSQSFTVLTERCPLDVWPDVPSTYIVMRDDRAVGPDWSRRVAREQINADVIEMDGGHSPFFARSSQLCDILVAISRK